MEIILDTKKSLEQNASKYFDKAKKAKKKIEGIKKALEQFKKEKKELLKKKEKAVSKEEEKLEKKKALSFEDELVEGSTQKPELFYLFQKKNFNYKRLIKLRENFLPEMRKTSEDLQRVRSSN